MKTRLSLLAAGLAFALPALAADWPQWRGPDRTGVSKETGLLQQWPKGGPKLLWTYRNAGLGFSTTAIVSDRIYTLGAIDEVEYVLALDVKGDKVSEAWRAKIGPIFTFLGNVWGDGPRGTPTVDGKYLYALGGQGELVCVETANGKEVWRKDLIKQLGGEMMSDWGYSESPLIDGDLLICTPGGQKGTLAALKKATGEVVWRSTDLKYTAPYSSIVVSEAGGVRQYVQNGYIDDTEGGVVFGVAAKDGAALWTEPFFKGSSYAIAPMPIVRGNLVYVTAGYGAGCHLFELTPAGKRLKAADRYEKRERKTMKNTHGGVVLVGNHVYGHSEGLGWVCQEFETGKVVWNERNKLECKSGATTAADGFLYYFTDEGEIALVKATPEGWQEQGTFTIPEKSKLSPARRTGRQAMVWTQPVIANGRLYLRDQELLFCYDIQAKK
ncbi:MAG TPA: PQQ-binding-like beta-propeller repeat protein [Gemmataceae bacterium]|nr:PQQ-binding-like beta-propeller repeat protein [Gemmataceae bacterium]